MDLGQINKFFFDLDQTLWNWDDTILGAEDLIHTLNEQDKNIYFHTDNSLLSAKGYARKLRGMDIKAQPEDVLTVNHVAGKYFDRKNIHKVYTIGEADLMKELNNHGIENSQTAEHVLLGLDRQFSYTKMKRAMKILDEGGTLYICSTEKTLKKSKEKVPHQKALNNALKKYACDVKLLGKPSNEFVNTFSSYFGYMPEKSLYIGDRLEDIEVGNKLGMKTALVMSGDMNRSELKKAEDIQKPDYGVGNLSKLSAKLRKSDKPF
jgi:HAD superfamily hydrolase (TIGR01450 family)